MRRVALLSATALLGLPLLAGCAAAGPSAADCDRIATDITWNLLASLASDGLAADPAALADAAGRPADGDRVALPDAATAHEQYDDAEFAQVWSALSSTSVGTGRYASVTDVLATLDEAGACA